MFLVRPRHQFKEEIEPSTPCHFVCKICQTAISQPQYLLSLGGHTPYHTFHNPSGYRFDIMVFSRCQSLVELTLPCLEHTWFAGYAWVILCCATCQEHLGWGFENEAKNPHRFFGMIQDKLELAPAQEDP